MFIVQEIYFPDIFPSLYYQMLFSFQPGLENLNQTLEYFLTCRGVQNSFFFYSRPGQNSRSSAYDKNINTDNRKKNQRTVEKKSYLASKKYLKGIPEQHFFY